MAGDVKISEGELIGPDGRIDIGAVIDVQAAITAASEAHALPAVYDATPTNAALNALGAKINAIITALENAGILTAN